MSSELATRAGRPGAFRESLASTLGTAAGLALAVGVPTMVLTAVAVYAGVSVVRGLRGWWGSRKALQNGSGIDVRELPSTSTATVTGVGRPRARRVRVRRVRA